MTTMADSLIVKPPRAFQVIAYFSFPEDARTDTELATLLLDQCGPSFSLLRYARGVVVQPIAGVPGVSQ